MSWTNYYRAHSMFIITHLFVTIQHVQRNEVQKCVTLPCTIKFEKVAIHFHTKPCKHLYG